MKITTDTILEQLKEWVENKMPINPSLWLEAAIKINVLKSDETTALFHLQQAVAKRKKELMETEDFTAAKAKVWAEASDIFREMKLQEAKISMIEEQIRLSKHMARMGQDDYKNQ